MEDIVNQIDGIHTSVALPEKIIIHLIFQSSYTCVCHVSYCTCIFNLCAFIF